MANRTSSKRKPSYKVIGQKLATKILCMDEEFEGAIDAEMIVDAQSWGELVDLAQEVIKLRKGINKEGGR